MGNYKGDFMRPATTTKPKKQKANPVRRPDIPALREVADYPLAQQMLALVEEIAAEQGTRTTKEINALVEVMRGSKAANVDLS
jgi:hypothetical protein